MSPRQPSCGKLMLEIGAPAILDSPLSDAVSAMTEEVQRLREVGLQYGVELEIVPYDGLNSTYAGGRPSRHSSSLALGLEVDIFNSHGISYMFAMNGGLTLPRDIKPSEAEMQVLGRLEENTDRFQVRNKVTITNGELLPLLRKRFPRLEVIASCIQSLEPRETASYAERFQKYDFVVPLNQHANPEYLAPFGRFAHKMILLLTLRCPNQNLQDCHGHYASMEPDIAIAAGLPRSTTGYWPVPGICADQTADLSLYRRQKDLAQLLAFGVTCFKIPRDQHIDTHQLQDVVLLYAGTLAIRRFEERMRTQREA